MKVELDKNLCVGCGLCEENLPELFRIGEYTAELKTETVREELVQRLTETVEDCPVGAITTFERFA